jgi:hypothetical protein
MAHYHPSQVSSSPTLSKQSCNIILPSIFYTVTKYYRVFSRSFSFSIHEDFETTGRIVAIAVLWHTLCIMYNTDSEAPCQEKVIVMRAECTCRFVEAEDQIFQVSLDRAYIVAYLKTGIKD